MTNEHYFIKRFLSENNPQGIKAQTVFFKMQSANSILPGSDNIFKCCAKTIQSCTFGVTC